DSSPKPRYVGKRRGRFPQRLCMAARLLRRVRKTQEWSLHRKARKIQKASTPLKKSPDFGCWRLHQDQGNACPSGLFLKLSCRPPIVLGDASENRCKDRPRNHRLKRKHKHGSPKPAHSGHRHPGSRAQPFDATTTYKCRLEYLSFSCRCISKNS